MVDNISQLQYLSMGVVLPDKPYFYIQLSQEENLTRSPTLEFFVCTWKGRGILGWIYFSGHRLVLSWREIAYIQRGQLFLHTYAFLMALAPQK